MSVRTKSRGGAGGRPATVAKPRSRVKRQPAAGQAREHAIPAAPAEIDSRLRHRMISEAAYLLAKERGFTPGGELDDWLQAEARINARLDDVAS